MKERKEVADDDKDDDEDDDNYDDDDADRRRKRKRKRKRQKRKKKEDKDLDLGLNNLAVDKAFCEHWVRLSNVDFQFLTLHPLFCQDTRGTILLQPASVGDDTLMEIGKLISKGNPAESTRNEASDAEVREKHTPVLCVTVAHVLVP